MDTSLIILISISVVGGIIGGMGMGGGTLLIPLLTVFCAVNQHAAQGLNLVAFLPMSAIVLIIHAKNKLIDYKSVPLVALPALATSIIAALFALKTGGAVLCRAYGIFLIVLGAYQIISVISAAIEGKIEKDCQNFTLSIFPNKF